MNYEQLLESRHGTAMAKQSTPFGTMQKSMMNGKYVHVITFPHELTENILFSGSLYDDYNKNKEITHEHQLHYTPQKDSAGLYGITLSQGTYTTFQQLLAEQPAAIARPHFLDDTCHHLLQLMSALHSQGIYHVCFAPSNVFVRKADHAVMLLLHGSAFEAFTDQRQLYGEAATYVAPEVLSDRTIDARSDIWSFGRFLAYLYQQSEVPLELRAVIRKATADNPNDRYQSADEMLQAITNRTQTRRSIITVVAALAVVALLFFLYFTLVPEREDVEFVKPVQETTSPLDEDTFNPEDYTIDDPLSPQSNTNNPLDSNPQGTSAGTNVNANTNPQGTSAGTNGNANTYPQGTSAGTNGNANTNPQGTPAGTNASANGNPLNGEANANAPRQSDRVYNAKAEQIFRKNFTKEAEIILGRIYNNEHMTATTKTFMAKSQSTLEELVERQRRLGIQAGLPSERSQLLATQIIDQVTAKLQAQSAENPAH